MPNEPEIPPVEQDYDVTLVSTTDTQAQVDAALRGEEPSDDDLPAEDPDAVEDEPAPAAEPVAAAGDEATPEGFEEPVDGESRGDRRARWMRNKERFDAQARELRELRQAKPPAPAEVTPDAPAPATAPTRTDEEIGVKPFAFQSWEEYSEANPEAEHEQYVDARTDARIQWTKDAEALRAQAVAAEQFAAKAEQAVRTLIATNEARVDEVRAAHPDYDAVIAASKAPLPPHLHRAMLKTGRAADIAYYLSIPENLAEAQRLASLSDLTIEVEVGALLATKVTATVAPGKHSGAPASRTSAPRASATTPSIRPRVPEPLPVAGGSAGPERDIALMDTDTYLREMDAQERSGRR